MDPQPLAVSQRGTKKLKSWGMLLALIGPGLMVMLADTDAGSVITAAQSGAEYKYLLVLPELLLIPILYLVQEMTARLGISTQRGHGALILDTFGKKWAVLSAGTLFIACIGALITEFAGVAGVGALVGFPSWLSIGAASFALIVLVLLGRYRRVEHVGIAVGALELLFIPAAFLAHPHLNQIAHSFVHPVNTSSGYLLLLAANVGAVIMPWMIFYQQEAVIDKGRRGLDLKDALRSARLDTGFGAVLTQVVMLVVVIATAATLGTQHVGRALNSVGEIASAMTPFLGHRAATIFFGLGLLGASVVAALVVTLAGAWGISEVFGWRHSLNDLPSKAKGFYGLAIIGVLSGALLVITSPNIINLSVDVEVLNACILPIVLGFLLALERKALPPEHQMHGLRKYVTYFMVGICIVFGMVTVAATVKNLF